MSRAVREALLHIAGGAVIVAAFGLAGSDDYQEAKRQEQVICSRQPAPEFCTDARR